MAKAKKDKADKEGKEAKEGGSKKTLILTIAGAVLLLLIGAGAAMFFMGAGDTPEDGAETAEDSVEVPEEGDPIYIDMKPKFVVSLPPGGPAKMLQVAVTVYTRQQPVAEFIVANDPMLRHHMNNLFEARPSAELLTLEGKQALQKALLEMFQEQLKEMGQPGSVADVYFTEFVLQ